MPFAHKIFRTKIAPERSLGRRPLVMTPLMKQQVTFQREGLSAFAAGERTLPGVTSHVIHQMFFSGKRFGANCAQVRGFARVLSQVIR